METQPAKHTRGIGITTTIAPGTTTMMMMMVKTLFACVTPTCRCNPFIPIPPSETLYCREVDGKQGEMGLQGFFSAFISFFPQKLDHSFFMYTYIYM